MSKNLDHGSHTDDHVKMGQSQAQVEGRPTFFFSPGTWHGPLPFLSDTRWLIHYLGRPLCSLQESDYWVVEVKLFYCWLHNSQDALVEKLCHRWGERLFPWAVFPFYFISSLFIIDREMELVNKTKPWFWAIVNPRWLNLKKEELGWTSAKSLWPRPIDGLFSGGLHEERTWTLVNFNSLKFLDESK